MFDIFVTKELGQGKLFDIATNITNLHHPSTELVDLITGQVVCRPGEDASMDLNILDNLDDDAALVVAKKRPSKRPRQSKKKKQEVEPPVANTPPVPEPESLAALTSDGQVRKLVMPSTDDQATIDNIPTKGVSTNALTTVGGPPDATTTQPSDGDNLGVSSDGMSMHP